MLLLTGTDSDLMPGDISKRAHQPLINLSVQGTAPIEMVELKNGLKSIAQWCPYSRAEPGNRIKIVWSGAAFRGRGRQTSWDGGLTVPGNRITAFTPINFHNQEKQCQRQGWSGLAWQSITTGGLSGVILRLKGKNAGTIKFRTGPKNLDMPVKAITNTPQVFKCGGLDRKVTIYRLPDRNRCRDLELEHQVKTLKPGDNPFYFRVEQEDGHLGWTSPIYVINNPGK
jgi:hypothetical protein